jgi:hypothetical protein
MGAGNEQGPVFDTSIREVADDKSIPKSLGFMPKPVYDDLTFTVGSRQMVKGFEEAVLGKKQGQTFTVTISQEMAYGPAIPELVYLFNTTQVLPLREVLSTDEFSRSYPDIGRDAGPSCIPSGVGRSQCWTVMPWRSPSCTNPSMERIIVPFHGTLA